MTIFMITKKDAFDALCRVFCNALFNAVFLRTPTVFFRTPVAFRTANVDGGVVWTAAGSRAVSSEAREIEHPALMDFLRSIENGVSEEVNWHAAS